MKNTIAAQKVKRHIQDYIRCYQENKQRNPPELALSNFQLDRLGLYGDSGLLFGLAWRRHP